MLRVLGLLAIVLSLIGLCGVLARGLRLAGIGVAAGLLLSAAGTRFLRAFVHGVDPFAPVAFAGAALAWMVIAMLASYVPALRASRWIRRLPALRMGISESIPYWAPYFRKASATSWKLFCRAVLNGRLPKASSRLGSVTPSFRSHFVISRFPSRTAALSD